MRTTTGYGLLSLAGGLLLLAGCSKTGGRVEDFTPPGEKARQALEAGLNHLQGGNPPGAVPGTSPRVEIVDTRWKAGQLRAFEVLGEDAPSADSSVPRFFRVRLTPASGPPQEVRYAVFGIDPLLVYREEDYKALSGVSK
jgi:hypothetical protein